MKTPWKLILVATATLGAAGCTYEAGSQIDNGSFGHATMHNMMAQMCKGYGSGVKGAKSGVVADPVVMLDPASSPSRPIYRVHCDGQLNGKYAQVIFREYTGSAVPAPQNAAIASQTDTGATSE